MQRMTLVGLSIVLVLCAVQPLHAAEAKKAGMNVEQEIRQIELDWADALSKGDQATIDRIEAADWTLADPDGNLLTKAQTDADLKAKALVVTSQHVDELKVSVHGETAIAQGLETEKSSYKGRDTSGQYRYTDVFVKHGGHWQAVVTHITRVAKP